MLAATQRAVESEYGLLFSGAGKVAIKLSDARELQGRRLIMRTGERYAKLLIDGRKIHAKFQSFRERKIKPREEKRIKNHRLMNVDRHVAARRFTSAFDCLCFADKHIKIISGGTVEGVDQDFKLKW